MPRRRGSRSRHGSTHGGAAPPRTEHVRPVSSSPDGHLDAARADRRERPPRAPTPPHGPTSVAAGLRLSTTYPGERSISSVVAGQTGLSAKTFASLADSGRYRLPPFLPRSAGTAEGFLFPDTYQLVKKGLTADTVIRRMLMQFRTEAKSLDLSGGARTLGLTPYQVVVVASMIEREAEVEGDRAKIASVIYNR